MLHSDRNRAELMGHASKIHKQPVPNPTPKIPRIFLGGTLVACGVIAAWYLGTYNAKGVTGTPTNIECRLDIATIAPARRAEDRETDKKPRGWEERTILLHPWTPLIVATIVAAQPLDDSDDKETIARLNEAVKLARDLINSPNAKSKAQGHLLMGSALSKLGKRTEGLKEYAKGMQLFYPGLQTNELSKLLDEHPAFQHPDASGSPNPVMAERHFGEAMHHYWSQQFMQAEGHLLQAVKYFPTDARYHYYMGLAQIQQKSKVKRDAAYFSFEQGARLEAQGRPSLEEINRGLERVQGELRQKLNRFRYKEPSELGAAP